MPESSDKTENAETPTPDESKQRPKPSVMRDILTLVRLPNLFTVVADTLMGLCIVYTANNLAHLEGASAFPLVASIPLQSLLLVLASVCFYAGGVVLNDRFDLVLDRRERPERPLPAGRISPAFATTLGAGLMLAGLAAAFVAAKHVGADRPGSPIFHPVMIYAYLLVAAILAYNGRLKSTRFSPIAMGGCRALNMAMVMSTAGCGDSIEWSIIVGLFIYVAGITWLAREEAGSPRRSELGGATVTLAVGLIYMTVVIPAYLAATIFGGASFFGMALIKLTDAERMRLLLSFTALLGMTLWRCTAVLRDPRPEKVRAAVGGSILMLIVIDALLIFSLSDPRWAVGVLLLILPAVITRRFVSPT